MNIDLVKKGNWCSFAVFLVGFLGMTAPTLAQAHYHVSRVFVVVDDNDYKTINGDFDGKEAVIGTVGEPFSATIHYIIGWTTAVQADGSELITEGTIKSDICIPEFEVFAKDPVPDGLLPLTGRDWLTDKGVIGGTPEKVGTWVIYLGVRDKNSCKPPYSGEGFNFTRLMTSGGKQYFASQDLLTIVILPLPSKNSYTLQCKFRGDGREAIFKVDNDNHDIKLLGNNGKIAGVYTTNVNDEIIGWNSMSVPTQANPYDSRSFIAGFQQVISGSIDRKTGVLTITYNPQNGWPNSVADCEKRSEVNKF